VSSIIYRQIEPCETAAVATLAREVFNQFVAPHYQPDGILEFHRYASANALSQRQDSGHVTFVAEHSGELIGMLHLGNLCHVAMLFVRPSFHHILLPWAFASVGDCLLPLALSLATQTASSPSIRHRMPFRLTNI
jgi:hypothetical protein